MDINLYKKAYQDNLLKDVIPFWMNFSPDDNYGGYFSCLERNGNVFDTDKFIWLQCREVWTFSMLYNKIEPKKEWLDFALLGADFLLKNGRDKDGNWYFSLTREGTPLVQPYNIFSDCFASMAFGQLYRASNNPIHKDVAKVTFSNILKRKNNPKGIYSKAFPGTRDLENFALPMILSNLVLEIEHILEPQLVNEIINTGINEVINKFYKPELGVILENVQANGAISNSFEGRLVNPGHGLEAMWFIMDLAERNNDKELIIKAVDISLELLEFGWDNEFEGIFYFKDANGFPPLQLEWDQKLWWVHIEAIIAMLKGYLHTGNEKCWKWFERLHSYAWKRFPDAEFGEWFGYLNREGKVLLPLKGGKWKGCFHVPRGLFQAGSILKQIETKQGLIKSKFYQNP